MLLYESRYLLAALSLSIGCAGKSASSPEPAASPPAVQGAPAASPAPSAVQATPLRGPALIAIPAGSFEMGSADPRSDADERPVHRVEVKAFEMDATEVTVAHFRACVEAGACEATNTIHWPNGVSDAARRGYEPSCNASQAGRDSHPMNCVDWNQAGAFCAWAGKRLPTEEEWEYAARGTDGRKYPWGNAEPDATRVNGCDESCGQLLISRGQAWEHSFYREADGYPETAPVGSFPAGRSAFGLEDMAGNVSEWTASELCSYADGTCKPGRRAIRGQSWMEHYKPAFSASDRTSHDPVFRHSNQGFRCAR